MDSWPVVIFGPKTPEHFIFYNGKPTVIGINPVSAWLYPTHLVRQAERLYTDVPVYDGHNSKWRLGFIRRPVWNEKYQELCARFEPGSERVNEAVMAKLNDLGFSHDIDASWKVISHDPEIRLITAIRRVHSVDMVSDRHTTKTGGRFLRSQDFQRPAVRAPESALSHIDKELKRLGVPQRERHYFDMSMRLVR